MSQILVDDKTRAILDHYGFDQIPFDALAQRLGTEGFNPDAARTSAPISHPEESVMMHYPQDEKRLLHYKEIGQRAIDANEVAVVILNGGMATRFGGVPKGAVPVVQGRSFLDLKLTQVHHAGGPSTPVFLMNSFATQTATQTHLEGLHLSGNVETFHQFVSLRMNPDGSLFLGADGLPSLHAPGHGDFPFALHRSGLFARLTEQNVRYITLSNVDNLGASLDPVIIGMHIERGNPISVELVAANEGDVGGFPAIVNGNLVIMEAFRLPAGFDPATISVFNTNTFVFDMAALANPPELSWFMVKKNVDGRPAIQCERLVGQLTEFMDVTWMVVPRQGSRSRFIPIKTVEDISLRQGELVARLMALGVL